MAYKNLMSKPGTIVNNAGGVSYAASDWDVLLRFLTIGSESGTYYVNAKKLTSDSTNTIVRCLTASPQRAIDEIVRVSKNGLAAKNDHAIAALALATMHGNPSAAYAAVNDVIRTGTHLLQFTNLLLTLRGTGRGLRKALAKWFLHRSSNSLAVQVVKYRQRDGISMRDVLRIAHPKTDDTVKASIFDWVCRGNVANSLDGTIIPAFELAKLANEGELITLIRENSLPWEAIPTEHLRSLKVWEALVETIGTTALIRNLGRLSNIGFFDDTKNVDKVVRQLTDEETLRAARIHPINVYIALRTYLSGHGDKGNLCWYVNTAVASALESAFYLSFRNVEPTGKRLLVAVDVSGSMRTGVNGVPNLLASELGATLALYFKKAETNVTTIAFDTSAREVNIRPEMTINDAVRVYSAFGGGTAISAAVDWAAERNLPYDAIILITDNETWADRYHRSGHSAPQAALERYRYKVNPNVKLICLSTTATNVDTVDKADKNQFGTAGFDASVPMLVRNFIMQ